MNITNITPINKTYAIYQNNKRVSNIAVKETPQDEFTPSFKGSLLKTSPKGKLAISSFLTGFIGLLGFSKTAQKDEIPLDSKQNNIGTDDMPVDQQEEKTQDIEKQRTIRCKVDAYDLALEINPDLAKNLRFVEIKHSYKDEDDYNNVYYTRAFDDYSVLRIVEENEKDKQSAIDLAQYLKFEKEYSIRLENLDFVISKFKSEPEIAKKYKGMTLGETFDILKAHENNAELVDDMKALGYSNPVITVLEKTEDIYPNTVREIVDEFKTECEINEQSTKYTIDKFAEGLAPIWEEKKEALKGIHQLLDRLGFSSEPDILIGLADLYIKNPEKLETVMKHYTDLQEIEIYDVEMNYDEDVSEYTKELEYLHSTYFEKEDLIKYINWSLKLDSMFKSMVETKSMDDTRTEDRSKAFRGHAYYDALIAKEEFINNIKDSDIEAIERIIQDNRLPESIKDFKNLVALYNKYPNTQITDKMIDDYNDPVLKCFDVV